MSVRKIRHYKTASIERARSGERIVKRLFSQLIIIISVTLSACQTASTELNLRQEIKASVRKALLEKNFIALENTYGKYRNPKSRTPSGLWMLSFFYDAFNEVSEADQPVSDGSWTQRETAVLDWARAYPKSPAPQIAYGRLLISHAWYFRGSDYASSVPEDAWKPFHEYIERARMHLEKNKEMARADPEWYGAMLTVANAQSWDRRDFDALFNEALSQESDYYNTYFKALPYLMPQWHGSVKEVDQFVRQSVERTKEQEGKSMYARIYWVVSDTKYQRELFTQSLANWKEMKAGFEDIIFRYPDAWNLNHFAYYACLAKDKKATEELLNRIGKDVMLAAWPVSKDSDPLSLYNYCRQHVAALY